MSMEATKTTPRDPMATPFGFVLETMKLFPKPAGQQKSISAPAKNNPEKGQKKYK